jgi:hypothetical protein
MPSLCRAALLTVFFALPMSAHAETQIFVLNGSDGYGIDRCLAAGESCGQAAAAALCRAHQYAQVVTFGRVDPNDITGKANGANLTRCEGSGCPETVAITCSR